MASYMAYQSRIRRHRRLWRSWAAELRRQTVGDLHAERLHTETPRSLSRRRGRVIRFAVWLEGPSPLSPLPGGGSSPVPAGQRIQDFKLVLPKTSTEEKLQKALESLKEDELGHLETFEIFRKKGGWANRRWGGWVLGRWVGEWAGPSTGAVGCRACP